MPPCAQTECERLTGTTEKRSTSWPASAIFIAAANPASPPPTTAILIPFAISPSKIVRKFQFVVRFPNSAPVGNDKLKSLSDALEYASQQTTGMNESNRRIDSNRQQQQTKRNASITGQALRALADRDSPIYQKQPDTICEMPDRSRDSN